MKKTIILACVLATFMLTGCSLQTKVGNAANTLVSNYCTKPVEERAVVRLWIDQATSPNQIRVNCAADTIKQLATKE